MALPFAVRLGAQGVETGTRGALYFDDFDSRRFSAIGTLPDPGADVQTAPAPQGWVGRAYAYDPNHPHAVTSVTSEQSSVDSYEYDENGNMTCRAENGTWFIQSYNAENRISNIVKLASGDCTTPGTYQAVWNFSYDGDGTRVAQLYTPYVDGQPQTDIITTYFMGGAYEVTTDANGATLSTKKYYSIAGMTVAMNDGSGLQYLLTDHLGSVVAITDSNGTLTSQQRYLPFGQVRTDLNGPRITQTDFGYTGQRALDMGLMDYKARFYDGLLGRFIQPDTIIPSAASPQSWNRFSYTLNNPIRYNDPSGHDVCSDDGYCGKLSDTSYLKHIYSTALKDIFKWSASSRVSLDGLKLIYKTGKDIEAYVDRLTNGKGLEWMNKYLGGTYIEVAGEGAPFYVPTDRGSSFPKWMPGLKGNTIFLPKDFMTGGYGNLNQYFAHELGHVWDANTGHIGLGVVGGVADALNLAIGGSIFLSGACRFCQPSGYPTPPDSHIPSAYYWNNNVNGGYGNGATADYLAEAFSWNVYNPANLPNSTVKLFIDFSIIVESSSLP